MTAIPRRTAARLILAAALATSCGASQATSGGGSSSESTSAAQMAPALVQVENSGAARPQWGLQDAAVVYEYVTEGGISRFSALYTKFDASRIGPVRSARRVTVRIASMYGAVIVYSGSSAGVKQALDSASVPHVDETASGGDLYRISDRPAPHNLVTDGGRLHDIVSRAGTSSTSTAALWPRTTSGTSAAGRAVSRVTVPVSTSEAPIFTYDAAGNGWRRTEPDTGAFVDAATGKPVIAATLVVQQVSITQTSDVEDVNGAFGVDHDLGGKGTAQVFTAGREYDASWSQSSSGPPSLTLADGSAAPVAPGLVWICLVRTGTRASTA